jgi:anti-sigma factor RsiW
MDHELTPEQIESLLPAYALDAVDDDERAAVDAYLAIHPELQAEVFSLQQTASLLGHSGGPAPASVWDKLEVAITEGAPRAALQPPAVPSIVVPLDRSHRRRSRVAGWLAVAAVVALVVTGLVVALDGSRDGASPSAAGALAAAARNAAHVPGARHVVLADVNGHELASAVVLVDGTGYLTVTAMPRLDASKTYQLWGLTNAHTISLGVLGRHPRVVAFKVAGDPLGLAITTEVAGGVAVSAQTPDAVGNLS